MGNQWSENLTSAGHLANYIFVLARTSPDDVKHRGITFLLVDMRQKGVEVRPIKMMSGDSEFNEVFFTDARCPKENVVGEVNGGWMVAMTLLGNERGAGAVVSSISFRGELDKLNALAQEKVLQRIRTFVSVWLKHTSKWRSCVSLIPHAHSIYEWQPAWT